MGKYKNNEKRSSSLVIAIVPAIIAAIAGIIASYFSYSAGIDAVRIPLIATQTAEAKQVNSYSTPASNSSVVPIAIDSQRTWQPTGIYLNKGDKVNIYVTGGKWTAGRTELSSANKDLLPENVKGLQIFVNYTFENEGSGTINTCTTLKIGGCPLPDEQWGKLIARIGLETPFSIGNQTIFTASSSDMLYLRINDNSLNDNFGILAISIEIEDP